MNKIILKYIFSILLCFQTCLAQNDGNFQPSLIGLNHGQKKLYDYLEIERLVLGGKYRTPSTEAWKSYARIYEEYTKLFCFDSVNYKFQSPTNPNLSESCRFYLRNLKKYHPDNVLLLCAEHGLGSEQCKNAYLSQYISREASFTDSDKSMRDFEDKISALGQENMKTKPEDLDKKLETLEDSFKQEETAEKWLEYKSLISEKIDYECQTVGVSFVDFMPPDFMMGSNLIQHQRYTSDQLYKEAYDLLHDPKRLGNLFLQGSFDKKEPLTEEQQTRPHPFEIVDPKDNIDFKPKPFWRIRRISAKCYESILRGLRFNSALPAAICNLHGNHSPLCLNADKELSKNLPLYIRKPKVEKPKYEMGTF